MTGEWPDESYLYKKQNEVFRTSFCFLYEHVFILL